MSNKKKKYKFLDNKKRKQIDFLFSLLNQLAVRHPYQVVLILHEYTRILYSIDPYIDFKIKNPKLRIDTKLKELIDFSKLSLLLGSYNRKNNKKFYFKFTNKVSNDLKNKTGNVYGPLWKRFKRINNHEALRLLKNRVPKKIFKNKKVLDAGCGGGRYSYAIYKIGAKSVIGLDYGDIGLKVAKKNYGKINNLSFKKGDVLNLPFKKNTFDTVFSNGVIHHTSNVKKGISELVRVCKKGGNIWLYLYSTGGIFWYSRRLMNELMKKIPYELSSNFLKMMELPDNRFIFMDNWYVPIEKHLSHEEIIKVLKKLNVKKIKKIIGKNKFDLDFSLKKYKNSGSIWGEGEIRFLIEK